MGLVESGKLPKPLTKLLNISRKYSMWVYQWGLACCAISEMSSAFASPRYYDVVMRPLPGVVPFRPAPAGEPGGHLGHGDRQDGPRHPAAALRADARSQVRDLDGQLRRCGGPTGTATR
ncbi:MAG: hypothetical protein R2749_02435 [Acidimicrobiales bacterium]